jgi:uncharacterized protein with PIN domain
MRFICDVMLGRLAKYLRILGFDAEYVRNDAASELHGSEGDDRVFLTRCTKVTGYPKVILIRSEKAREQIKEIKGLIQPGLRPEQIFSRCVECNAELVEVDKREIEPLVAEFVYHRYAHFKQCLSCKRVYWEGTHTEGMGRLLKEILS